MPHPAQGRAHAIPVGAFAIALLTLVTGALAGWSPRIFASGHAISFSGSAFRSSSTIPAAGDAVAWTNDDLTPHDVNSVGEDWQNDFLSPRAWFSHTFAETGTYAYICSVHPFVKDLVVIQ